MLSRDFPFLAIERHSRFEKRNTFRHVVFDFDGTLSFIRGGWADLMVEGFMETLPLHPGETKKEVAEQLRREILALNGKQTIFQMVHFTKVLRGRGVTAKEPEYYAARFQSSLLRRTAERMDSIKTGRVEVSCFLVFDARHLLEKLTSSGASLYLVSGTEYKYVREEVEALRLAHFFGEHIYGPKEDHLTFSKMKVMTEICRSHDVRENELLSFGDGPVEIQNTKMLGGVAVGVASDENNPGSGEMDPSKRHLLLQAGADFIMPDYREAAALLDWLEQTPATTAP